jgi:TolB-like protein/DNA-binding winged helix-turn-helix (wHTH) protein/Tfp pilus assembly protein PilF
LVTEPSRSPQPIRFGVFELDLSAGELRKKGVRIKLQEQPFQILVMLLERPGQVVTREELHQKLWPEGTFVDFEHGLNAAIQRLREVLGDSADTPRYVETLPRRGYRFIYSVEGREQAVAVSHLRIPPVWIGALAVVALAAVLVGMNVGGLRDRLLGGPAPGEITSIAVLPLENLSGDPEQDYFADGMTEALIIELGKISALRVISRQSVMQFKGTKKSLPEIARELNVDAIVEGAVLRADERVRISAQLIQAVPEQHLWAESYERDLSRVLALQGEVARAIASKIKVTLTPQEEARLAGARPVNPEAYEAYLKGRYFWNKRTEEGFKKGIEYFQQAIEKDPGYALAYAGVADSYLVLADWAYLAPDEAYPTARVAATQALETDDSLAEAHTSLAYIRYVRDWDWSGAERQFKRAIELNPNYANAHQWYAEYLSAVGRHDKAIAEIKRAQELDPLSLIINAVGGWVFFKARQYDQAIEQCRKTLDMDPDFIPAHYYLGLAYVQKEMYGEAISHYQQAVTLSGTSTAIVGALGHAYAVSGKSGEALKVIDELKRGRYVPSYKIALIFTGLGEKELAFAWLEKGYKERDFDMVWVKVDPMPDLLRSDPRFHSLRRRLNFPE